MEEIKKKRSYKKLGMICLLSAGVMLTAFGGTLAYYSDTLKLPNPLRTSNTSVAMVEDYNPNQSFLPGETAVKKVFFENTGDMDLLLRVEVLPQEGWYDIVEGTTYKAADELNKNLQPEKVIKNWTKNWTIKTETRSDTAAAVVGNTPVSVPAQVNDVQNAKEGWGDTEEWTEAIPDQNGDKYYRYYRKVLYAGDNPDSEKAAGYQTQPILESIILSTDVTNDRHETNYSNKIYKLTFNAEAVPVDGDGTGEQLSTKNEWHMSATISEDGTVSWAQSN